MVDVTHKINTLRTARAQAIVSVGSQETIAAIVEKRVPKGDVFEMSKTAGLFAVKKTSDVIPDCHPLPVEFCKIDFEIEGLEIIIKIEVKTIYKTGVEVEAMHGVSVVALTIYDMLKPIDKQIEIKNIKLLEKKGGKSGVASKSGTHLKAAVIVISDSVSAGKAEDKSGKAIVEFLERMEVEIFEYSVIPDELIQIREKVEGYCSLGVHLVVTTGGTGLSPRDFTTEAIRPILDKEVPGIMEAARNYGQQRTPYAMLSRSIAGIKGKTLILTLPGSTKAVMESMTVIFPYVCCRILILF